MLKMLLLCLLQSKRLPFAMLIILLTAVVLANFNVALTFHDVEDDAYQGYQGPGADSLYAFWPLDYVSKLEPYFVGSKQDDLGNATYRYDTAQLVKTKEGPFGMNCTSHSGNAKRQHFAAHSSVKFPESFTISVFLKQDDSFKAEILRLPPLGFSIEIMLGAWSDMFAFIDAFSGTRIWVEVPAQQWTFFAVTYDKTSRLVVIYDEDGILLTSDTLPKPLVNGDSLLIGSMTLKTQIACLQIFKAILSRKEIGQLACVCQTRGRCPNGIPNQVTRPYLGPKQDALAGYWPNVEKVGELLEMENALAPFEISTTRIIVNPSEEVNGPIKVNRTLFAPNASSSWVSQFFSIGQFFPGDSSFTITFYLYVKGVFFWDCTLIQWGSLLELRITRKMLEVHLNNYSIAKVRYDQSDRQHWYFVALTYEKLEKLVTFYDENGLKIGETGDVVIDDFTNNGESPGLSIGPKCRTNLDVAIACLSIHDAVALNASEIAKMRCVCEESTRLNATIMKKCAEPGPIDTSSITSNNEFCDNFAVDSGKDVDNFEFQGPRKEALYAFWPFDYASNVNAYYLGKEALPQLCRAEIGRNSLLERRKWGPIIQGSCLSFTLAETGGFLINYPNARLPPQFTLSFYFRPISKVNFRYVLRVPAEMKDLEPFFSIEFNYKTLAVRIRDEPKRLELPIYWQSQWHFVAIVYENVTRTLTAFGKTGHFLGSFQVASANFPPNSGFELGRLSRGDQLSCLLLYSEPLSIREIVQIPCVCESRGRCSEDGKQNRTQEFRGPRKSALTAYFPLIDKVTELDEIQTSRLDQNLRAHMINAKRISTGALGVFNRPRGLFAAEAVNAWAVEFWDIIPPRRGNFTIAFYLYSDLSVMNYSKIDLVQLGELVISISGNNDVILVVRPFEEEDIEQNIGKALSNGHWTFIAFTGLNRREITLFNESGDAVSRSLLEGRLFENRYLGLNVGPKRLNSSIACLSIFNETLNSSEIAQLRCTCQKTASISCSNDKTINVVGIPRFDSLVAFLPLDFESEFLEIAKGLIRPGFLYAENRVLIKNENGPFGGPSSSYSVVKQDYAALYEGISSRSSDFTVGFHFFLANTSNYGQMFSFNNGSFRFGYSQRSAWGEMILSNSNSSSRTFLTLPKDRWAFLALSYNFQMKRASLHDGHGNFLVQIPNFTISSEFINDFAIGPFNPNDRIACTIVYNHEMPEIEIARLRCVCRTRGYCSDETYLNSNSKPYRRMPHQGNLLAYWPLDEISRLLESFHSKQLPSRISGWTQLVTGPFNKPNSAFATKNNETSFFSYKFPEGMPKHLTFTFYLKAGKTSFGGNILEFKNSENVSLLSVTYTPGRIIELESPEISGVRARFPTDNLPGDWAFVGVTYLRTQKEVMFAAYGGPSYKVLLQRPFNRNQSIGEEFYANRTVFLSVGRLQIGDALACLLVWNENLQLREIAAVPEQCELARIPIVSTSSKPTSKSSSTVTTQTSSEESGSTSTFSTTSLRPRNSVSAQHSDFKMITTLGWILLILLLSFLHF